MKFSYRNKYFDIVGTSDTDHIYHQISTTKTFYECDLLEYAEKFIKSNNRESSICIDVGANIGNHSIFFGSFISKWLISVEPNNSIIPILKTNLSNNASNYTLYEVGLSSEGGSGQLVFPERSENNVGMAMIDTNTPGDIKLTTLDIMFNQWCTETGISAPSLTLIKIDVEGMELEVLRGGMETIQKYRPHLLIEAATKQHLIELNILLNKYNYFPVVRFAGTPVYHFCYKPSAYFVFTAKVYKLMKKLFGL
jgi:protein O-GlcNAc transferase